MGRKIEGKGDTNALPDNLTKDWSIYENYSFGVLMAMS
jgi:hypothetical protein